MNYVWREGGYILELRTSQENSRPVKLLVLTVTPSLSWIDDQSYLVLIVDDFAIMWKG